MPVKSRRSVEWFRTPTPGHLLLSTRSALSVVDVGTPNCYSNWNRASFNSSTGVPMAKKNGKPNKSDAIREELAQNPKAKSKEIIDALAARGIKVAPSLIYFVKGKASHAKRK